MADPIDTLRGHLAAVAALERRTRSGLAGIGEVEDVDLVALVPAVQALATASAGLVALVAGEIASRDGEKQAPSLARRLGYRNAAGLVAGRGNLSYDQAHRLVDVGEAIRPAGPGLDPERPHVAEAVLAGELTLEVASTIDRTLEALRDRLTAREADVLEGALVERATGGEVTVKRFLRDCARLLDAEDPDGSGDRDALLRSKASYREARLANGLLRIVAELDPVRAAYYLAAMTARTDPQRPGEPAETDDDSNSTDLDGGTEDAAVGEGAGSVGPGSTGPQPDPVVRKLDAFTQIMRDDLARDTGDQAGVATTVLVRIDLQDLLDGTGAATIDGIDTPVSAGTARRMAVEADLIPQVFGGRSQLLDQGEARRLFSRAQRYAIWAEHDGCAFPGCDLPLSMTQIHHIGAWATRSQHGRGTDLTNGIPLCGFRNRLMEAGWDLRTDADGTPWFTPPALVDPKRAPLRGSHRTPPPSHARRAPLATRTISREPGGAERAAPRTRPSRPTGPRPRGSRSAARGTPSRI